MIEFLTLFLGAIVTGPTEVQMMVSGDVAAVEIRLDQDSLAVLRASPCARITPFTPIVVSSNGSPKAKG